MVDGSKQVLTTQQAKMLNITFLDDATGIDLGDLFLVQCHHSQIIDANLFTQDNQKGLGSENDMLGGLIILKESELLVFVKSRVAWVKNSHVYMA